MVHSLDWSNGCCALQVMADPLPRGLVTQLSLVIPDSEPAEGIPCSGKPFMYTAHEKREFIDLYPGAARHDCFHA